MPPKKAAKQKTPSLPPLDGCVIALSGTFPGHSQPDLERNFIVALGATLAKSITASVTHLVTSEADFNKPSTKVKQAQQKGVPIISLAWLEDCLEKSAKLNEDSYKLGGSAPAAPAPAAATGNGKAIPSRKRNVKTYADVDVDEEEDEDDTASQAVPKKRARSAKPLADADSNSQSQTKSKKATNGSASQSQAAPAPVKKEKKEPLIDDSDGRTNIAKSLNVQIPIDEYCGLVHYKVYIDDQNVIYDANLNQTNASNNNNKFYRVQLLHSGSDYKTWTRWGRVGERGASAMLGGGSLGDAMSQFEKKFKDKSGLQWADRASKPKNGKYTFIERSYDDDSDEEDKTPATQGTSSGAKTVKVEPPESKLHPSVQELMELIFNQQYFAAAMTELNYDANKLPLGKLSKSTITRGYQALKDLSELIDDPTLAGSEYGLSFQDAAENLSNQFYSLIPHAFGRNRPPVIHTQAQLNAEIDLMDSLSDMKDAQTIMKKDSKDKDAERMNALDNQFNGLNLDEMTPLPSDTLEFKELREYLMETKGQTHAVNYQITDIFRISRRDEKDRFVKGDFSGPPKDRRLLWHGSRATNFGGILSQGLRIAPPEAPVSGYMFGKGIYLADMSSKSANYCCHYISNGHALLLLCEAELGNPIQELTNASYSAGDDAKAGGMYSTWGQGTTGPSLWKDCETVHPTLKGVTMPDTRAKKPGNTGVKNAYLQYNEYITYDVQQVKLRYLFRVKM